jgi:hypothetical protein
MKERDIQKIYREIQRGRGGCHTRPDPTRPDPTRPNCLSRPDPSGPDRPDLTSPTRPDPTGLTRLARPDPDPTGPTDNPLPRPACLSHPPRPVRFVRRPARFDGADDSEGDEEEYERLESDWVAAQTTELDEDLRSWFEGRREESSVT